MKKLALLAGLMLLFSAGTLWADAPGLKVGVFLKDLLIEQMAMWKYFQATRPGPLMILPTTSNHFSRVDILHLAHHLLPLSSILSDLINNITNLLVVELII